MDLSAGRRIPTRPCSADDTRDLPLVPREVLTGVCKTQPRRTTRPHPPEGSHETWEHILTVCWSEKIGRVSQGLLVLSRGRVIVQDVPAIIFAGHQQSKQSGVVPDRGITLQPVATKNLRPF